MPCISSDHLPVLTKLNIIKRKQRKRKARWNFKKANWELFREISEKKIKETDTENKTIEEINSDLTSAILDAAKKSIPRGCRNNYKPFWNEKLQKVTEEKDVARKEYEKDPDNVGKKIEYKKNHCKGKTDYQGIKKGGLDK